MSKERKMQVSAIKNGTVVDHIPNKALFKVISLLGLDKIDSQITFGTNLESKNLGLKAIIKISDYQFKDDDINKISLIAPQAKINIISDYNVVEKKIVTVPDVITGIAKCVNPKCITNHEDIKTKFAIINKSNVALKCHYCEKITEQEQIELI